MTMQQLYLLVPLAPLFAAIVVGLVAALWGLAERNARHEAAARFVEFGRRDLTVGNVQSPIGRNDIDVVGLQRLGRSDLGNRHGRPRRQNAGKIASTFRIEMHDYDEGGAG